MLWIWLWMGSRLTVQEDAVDLVVDGMRVNSRTPPQLHSI
jgi:hypothetical protein